MAYLLYFTSHFLYSTSHPSQKFTTFIDLKANFKSSESAGRRTSQDLDVADVCSHVGLERIYIFLHLIRGAFHYQLHPAIGQVPYESGHSMAGGNGPGGISKSDALHPTRVVDFTLFSFFIRHFWRTSQTQQYSARQIKTPAGTWNRYTNCFGGLSYPGSIDLTGPILYPSAAMMFKKIGLPVIFLPLVGYVFVLNAQEPLSTTGQQLLLLRNGQALEGEKIIQSGDSYRVVFADGEIRVKTAEVEMLCNDLEEGYQRKRMALSTGSLRERLELAQWCERHRLYDHAAAELADAAAIAPENAMVDLLRRRLRVALEPAIEPPKRETSEQNSSSNEELDRMVRGLPRRAVENFTQSVQPLLMNNCTSSGCHGPQSQSGLRLERVSMGQPAGRRTTQRNIRAVLQYVDRNNLLASRILTVPTVPHGEAKTAVFTKQQATQYKRLVDWVLQLGPADVPKTPAIIPDAGPITAETVLDASSGVSAPHILSLDARKADPLSTFSSKREADQAVFHAPMSKPEELRPASDSESNARKGKHAGAAAGLSGSVRGVPTPQFTTKDPFDPEIFNRRYLKSTPPDEASTNDKSTGGK
jgi:hypothetical protein